MLLQCPSRAPKAVRTRRACQQGLKLFHKLFAGGKEFHTFCKAICAIILPSSPHHGCAVAEGIARRCQGPDSIVVRCREMRCFVMATREKNTMRMRSSFERDLPPTHATKPRILRCQFKHMYEDMSKLGTSARRMLACVTLKDAGHRL